MATALIRLGDSTSHGGSAIEASGHCSNGNGNGNANLGLARAGELTSYPTRLTHLRLQNP